MMRMEDTLQKETADNMSAELQVGFLVRTAEQRMSVLESHAERTQAESDEKTQGCSQDLSAQYSRWNRTVEISGRLHPP
ncbi:MAG: hypothetical protein ACKPKO_55930, partial [Candidatus Fonsibacter sp.]